MDHADAIGILRLHAANNLFRLPGTEGECGEA